MPRRLFFITLLLAAILCNGRDYGPGSPPYHRLIAAAEAAAAPTGKRVMKAAMQMTENSEIIRGSCWNWLDTAYRRAGYPKGKRVVLFGSPKSGPYADLSLLRPGDWIYHVNHSYHNIEHSGMFIGWIDRSRNRALMLSYGGEGRRKPGRYRPYDITHTYRIIRPGG